MFSRSSCALSRPISSYSRMFSIDSASWLATSCRSSASGSPYCIGCSLPRFNVPMLCAAHNQWHHDQRAETLVKEDVFAGILAFLGEVRPEERALVEERPAGVAAVESQFEARHEMVRGDAAFSGDQSKDLLLLVVEKDRAAIELNHRSKCGGDRLKKRVAGEIEDDGVVDREQRPRSIRSGLEFLVERGDL